MFIGIYGGSFNPIHFGHLGLARWVVEHTELDEVWLMVTPNNPLKDSTILAPEKQRLAEAQAAVQRSLKEQPLTNGKIIRVSDLEFSLPRPSFTAQTLAVLQQTYPNDRFALVIGEDNWQIFTRWRDWEKILLNHRIYVYPRHCNLSNDKISSDNLIGDVHFLRGVPYFDISSTQIRNQKIN